MAMNMNTTISLKEAATLLQETGSEVSHCFQGEPGIGKSYLLLQLQQTLPSHRMIYFDMTTKDVGDMAIPYTLDANGVRISRMAPSDLLGLHESGPIVLMLDEIGKAPRAVQNAVLPILHERRWANEAFHKESIVFCTTNLTTDGVGDAIPAHALNRMCMTTIRKPTADEWFTWGLDNDVDPMILAFVNQFKTVMASYTDPDQKDNPYIYQPTKPLSAFVTPRSLHKASAIAKKRAGLSYNAMMAAFAGLLGESAARDLSAFVAMGDQLDTMENVVDHPKQAKVPENAAALCLMMSNLLVTATPKNMDIIMDYVNRVPKEAQALFGKSVVDSSKCVTLLTPKFREWARKNNYLFGN